MVSYSIGVGLTSACPYSCPHCYSGAGRNPVHLDTARLFRFIDGLRVSAINLGTGEASMHPEFHRVVDGILERGVPLALTTAGPSLDALPDRVLKGFHDVDVSIDFPEAESHDAVRGSGAFRKALDGIIRCRELGVTVSVAMCLMRSNAELVCRMCELIRELAVPLRVNVYKPVFLPELKPSFDLFWSSVQALFKETRIVSCSEPVVNAALAYHGGSPGARGALPAASAAFESHPEGKFFPASTGGLPDSASNGF